MIESVCMGRLSGTAAALAGIGSENIRVPVRLQNNKHAYYQQGNEHCKEAKNPGKPGHGRCMRARASFV
jgi:hypothetical protein